MNWARRTRWRWIIIGSALWLILLSSISLQEGHPKFAQWTSTAAITLAVLAVLTGMLRLLGQLVLTAVRGVRRQVARSRRRPRLLPRSARPTLTRR